MSHIAWAANNSNAKLISHISWAVANNSNAKLMSRIPNNSNAKLLPITLGAMITPQI